MRLKVWKKEYWVNADMLSICLMDFKIGTWNIRGLSTSDKQDAIVKLIQEEKLQICVVLETHLKNKRIEMEDGCMMFKTVKNLKGLKKHLKQLSWCNGDVFENVKKLRESYEICPKED
ncbi:RNA-directed DNA polymerase, eukaryota, reverse transcriptase zinc-binding domain protein [Tanacetum coccineum]